MNVTHNGFDRDRKIESVRNKLHLVKIHILENEKKTNIPLNYYKWYTDTLHHTFGTLVPLSSKN